MDKQEYLKRRTQIYNSISELEKQLYELKQEYIKSSPLSDFRIGERVLIKRPERIVHYNDGEYRHPEEQVYAYIKSFYLDVDCNVKVELLKETKKGKPSKEIEPYAPNWGDVILKL